MPVFEVTSPDGVKYRVNAPEGATQDQAIAYIQSNMAKPKAETPSFDPTEGMTGPQKFFAGMGKAMTDLGRGAGQIVGLVDQKDIDEAKRLDAPLMKTGAGLAGNIVGNAIPAAATLPIPGANTYTGAALTGATLAGLQPMAKDENRLLEAAKGAGFGVLGQFGGNAIGRAVKPVQANPTAAESELINKARALNINLNAAQETGSKPLKWIDSALDNLPFTSDRQAALKLQQRQAWQQAVLDQVGEKANMATPDVLGGAYSRLGNQFKDLSARNTVTLGNDFLNSIAKIDASKTPFSTGIDSVVEKALDLASKGKISGSEYQTVRTSLTNASKGAWSQNPELGQALKSLRNALDDAAGASVSAEDKAAWEAVRSQYKALKTVEKATDTTTGAISPKKLINELGRANPQGMKYGFGDQTMPDIARVGKQFIAEGLPDSGTAQRSWYMNMLQNPSAGLGGLLGFMHGGPVGAAVGTAAGAATPLAAQRALWSNGRYLRGGLLDPEIPQNTIRPLVTGGLLSTFSE